MNNVHIFENVGLKCKTENNKIIILKTLVGYNNFQDSQVGSSVPYLIRNVAQNKYEVGVGELGKDENGKSIFFCQVAKIYDYVNDDGYNNMGDWIEKAAKEAGR